MSRIVIVLAGLLLPTVWTVPATAAGTTQAQRVHVIVLDKMVFGLMPTGVRAGDVIEWVNHDIVEHRASAGDSSFDVDLKPGATLRPTAERGSFVFFCKFHPAMHATLVVK